MKYIRIENGVPLRGMGAKGRGHIHAIVGSRPDGAFVEQSKDHGQIVQRVLLPDGRLVVTRFAEEDGEIRPQDEFTIHLRDRKVGGTGE